MTKLGYGTAVVLILITACAGPASHLRMQSRPGEAPEALRSRNREFLAAVASRPVRQLIEFFPRAGSVTYRHTVYSASAPTTTEQTFFAGDIPAALNGPLSRVFTFQAERQIVGLFAHQLTLRGSRWSYVGDDRFVPPGADRSAVIFVEWRLENGRWVISSVGDEEFKTGALLPAWCC